VVDGDVELGPHLDAGRQRRPAGLDPDGDRPAQELEARVLLQRPRQHPGLAQHLEPVADADHRPARSRVGPDRLHDGREAGDGPGSQVVTVGEPARQDDGVDPADAGIAVPQEAGLAAQAAHGLGHVELAVGAGEYDDADDRGHQLVTAALAVMVAV
jgi:hypothetical protein